MNTYAAEFADDGPAEILPKGRFPDEVSIDIRFRGGELRANSIVSSYVPK